ncbi:MAG: Bax inhibitor-1 family protein [Mycoplasmoidaceae bacterium]
MPNYQTKNNQQSRNKIYSKRQTSMLSNALFVAGIGFVFTALLGFLTAFLFRENSISGDTLYYLGGPLIFISVILSIVWQFRIEKASNFFMFSVVAIYCIANGIGFGSIFLALNMEQIMIAFGMTGFIFLGTFGVSKIMSVRAAMNLGKILFISAIIYLLGSLIISLSSWFWIGTSNRGYFNILIISTVVGGLLSVGYLAYSLWLIQNMDKFLTNDDDLRRKYSIFFGFMLLINLISIVYRILQLMLIFDRN